MNTIVKEPNLYDLLYADVTEDINLYLCIAKKYDDILEFGAGTGRVTIPLAEDGHNIVAVDIEQAMLDKLQEKINSNDYLKSKIRIVKGDMCNYSDKKKYNCIFIPLTSFNYLLTREEQLSCLKTLQTNLSEDGIAIIELLSEKTFSDTNSQEKLTFIKKIHVDDKKYYQYWRNTVLDMQERKITQRRVFKLFDGNNQINEKELIWKNRFVTISDFISLANECGLDIDTIYGDCKMGEYNDNSEDVFVKVKRKVNHESNN